MPRRNRRARPPIPSISRAAAATPRYGSVSGTHTDYCPRTDRCGRCGRCLCQCPCEATR